MKQGVLSIQSLISDYLKSNKDKFILFQKKGYRTFSIKGDELYKKILKTKIFLRKYGIKKGDKLILIGNNSIDWIIVSFVCILSGIVLVPLDVNSDKSFFKKIQKEINAKIIFQDRGIQKFSKIRTFYLDELNLLIKNVKYNFIKEDKINPNDILEIIYTSGATGKPKGVILTNENITSAVNSAMDIKLKNLKVLNPLPLSHIFSQIYGLFLMIDILLLKYNYIVYIVNILFQILTFHPI